MSAVSFATASLLEHFKLAQRVIPHINAKQPLVTVVWSTLTEIYKEVART